MVAAGIPEAKRNHAELVCEFALDLLASLEDWYYDDKPVQVRIGIHSGPVVAGVIGKAKLTYDVWGDTVNKASRMESTGVPGKIHLSEETHRYFKNSSLYEFENRGVIKISGIGEMNTYFLVGRINNDQEASPPPGKKKSTPESGRSPINLPIIRKPSINNGKNIKQ